MKKVLIISYFFPPCNLTASQRPFSWYSFLHEMGYYPIVVTRKWEKEIKTYADVNQLSSKGIEIEKQHWGEIHYVPYEGNKRDRLMEKHGMDKYRLLRKFLSFLELLGENLSLRFIPYRNMYGHAATLLKQEAITGAVISAGPFPQFMFGYLLKKNFGLKWIADYRDDWSTSEVENKTGKLGKLLKILNKWAEKKWVGTAEAFTSISPYYVQKIERLVNNTGHVLQNGFTEMDVSTHTPSEEINLLYNGTLYPTQPIEQLLEAVASLGEEKRASCRLQFPGLAIDEQQKNRVTASAKALGIESQVHITARIPKAEILQKQKDAFALLMVGHKGLKGIPSSKLYEYLSLGKPIILFEPDGDILEEIIARYDWGFIVNKHFSFDEIITSISELYQQGASPNRAYIEQFSRKSQVKELANLMNTYF